MKNLIVTGWFWKDYACAAALALRHYQRADVVGMSARRLPEFLNTVSGCQEIAILGVGLSGDQDLLLKALTRLAASKVRVRWISAMDFPEELAPRIREKLDAFIYNAESVTEAVSRCFDQPSDDLAGLVAEEDSPATRGYRVLLAHPEKYDAFKHNWEEAKRFLTETRGVFVQLEAWDIGKLNPYSWQFIESRTATVIGTDSHGMHKRQPAFDKAAAALPAWAGENRMRKEYVDRLLGTNAAKLLKEPSKKG